MRNNPDVHDPHPCHTDSSLPVYTCGIMESAYDQFTEGENVCVGGGGRFTGSSIQRACTTWKSMTCTIGLR